MHQARARLAQLQHGTPEHEREHEPHEVEILREFPSEPSGQSLGRLRYHRVGKQRGAQKQRDRHESQVFSELQLAKNNRVQADQCDVQGQRQ